MNLFCGGDNGKEAYSFATAVSFVLYGPLQLRPHTDVKETLGDCCNMFAVNIKKNAKHILFYVDATVGTR